MAYKGIAMNGSAHGTKCEVITVTAGDWILGFAYQFSATYLID